LKVHILTTTNFISYFFLYPLLVNKNRLKEHRVSIKYFEFIKDSIYDCDAILLDSKYFSLLWDNREYVLSILDKIKDKCKQVIWLDSSASTGTTHFQVLPFVHKYWKKQLLKDRNLYEKQFYGARIYTDYYKKQFNLEDQRVGSFDSINRKYLNKLTISWNLGFGSYSANRRVSNILGLIPWCLKEKLYYKYRLKAVSHDSKRRLSVCFRGSSRYTNKALSFQRMKIIEKLQNRGVDTKPVSYRAYINELRNAKIAVSPFGAGEMCFRDFEIILSGSLLLKPSMDHLMTWPDFFIDNENYVSVKWDFSDFDDKIESLLGNPERIRQISLQAQKRYIYWFSSEGQEKFCERFMKLIC